jgi:hypothetical protein
MKPTLLALGVCLLAATAAWALEAVTPVSDSVSIIETLKVQYDVTDADHPFTALINRLNLGLVKGPFAAGLRYDTEAYLLEEEYYVKYIPEKFFAQYDGPPFLMRLGDSYARFGNGLTLSLLKRDEFGKDTTIQGGLARVSTDYFEFEGLIGPVNPGDDRRFDAERAKQPEPAFFDERDLLWGARFWAGHTQYFKLGGTWVGSKLRYDPDDELAEFERDDDAVLYSILFEAPNIADVGSLGGEYAWLEYSNERRRVEDQAWEGRAAYLTDTWYFGPVTFTGEVVDYFRFKFPYNEPPSLEYSNLSFGHLPNYDDAIGFRARLDANIPRTELAVFANYTRLETHDGVPVDLRQHYSDDFDWLKWIEHVYAGFDINLPNGGAFGLQGGYRENVDGRYLHASAETRTPIVTPHSLNAEAKAKQFYGFRELSGSEFLDLEGALGYAYAPYFAITGLYEWSDEPASGLLEEDAEKEDDPHFWSVETVVTPRDWVRILLGYGRYKGGIRCAGGVCRYVPPFEGLKSEISFRF